jgi:iron complex outermembrane recepter protein
LQIEPYGLERVEVLRGPSSVMYGQNPPGGIVAMSSKLPYEGAANEIFIQGGSFDHAEAGFDLNGGSEDGSVLYRMVGIARDANTQVDFVENNRYFFAPSLTWKADEGTSLTVFGQVQIDRAGIGTQYYPALGTLLNNPLGEVDSSLNLGEPGRDRMKRDYYALGYLFEHQFHNGLTFRQNGRYATADTENYSTYLASIAADNRTLGRRAGDINRRLEEYTLDNQLLFDVETGPLQHKLIGGLDIRRSTIDNYNGFALLPGTIDLFDPVYGGAAPTINHTADNYQTLNQVGLYAQDQIKFDNWILTLGGRYDVSDTKLDNRYAGTRSNADDKAFTGRAGLGYLFDNGIAPYIAYSTSFEPILGTTSPERGSRPFEPTEGEQFEAGIKYQPEGFNGFFSAALFDLTQTNVSTVDPSNISFQIQTGEVRSRGLELEGRAEIASGLSLIASYSYTDTEVIKTNMPGQLGNQLPLIPRHQASLWLDYDFAGTRFDGVKLRGGVRYIGDSYGDAANEWKTSAYTLVDASLSLDLEKFWQEAKGTSFQLNVNNLFDKEHLVGCNSAVSCEFGQRRTIYATLRHRW